MELGRRLLLQGGARRALLRNPRRLSAAAPHPLTVPLAQQPRRPLSTSQPLLVGQPWGQTWGEGAVACGAPRFRHPRAPPAWLPPPSSHGAAHLQGCGVTILRGLSTREAATAEAEEEAELELDDEDDLPTIQLDDQRFRFDNRFTVTPMLLIHPIMSRQRKGFHRLPEHEIEEATRLVEGLGGGGYEVVGRPITGRGSEKGDLFGKGTVVRIGEEIALQRAELAETDKEPLAVAFLNTTVLPVHERTRLEAAWQIQLVDRYSVILQIFRTRASTAEAKLQVALAEIPYLRQEVARQRSGDRGQGAGSGETPVERLRHVLQQRETAIKKRLEAVAAQKALVQRDRARSGIPIVALMGYTNVGKSALLKAMTHVAEGPTDVPLSDDRLFHTLNTTARKTRLPNGTDVLVLDTVGFISNLPHQLVAAFRSTLSEVLGATVIVHVRDASHPELAFQAREVERVLAEDLKATPEQLSSVIQVFNKVDLVPKPERSFSEARALTTCAKSGEGVHELLQVVEARIVELSGEVVRKIRIPMVDTERLSWLHTNAAVLDVEGSADGHFLEATVRIKPSTHRRYDAMIARAKS